jgi:hypothetical protein
MCAAAMTAFFVTGPPAGTFASTERTRNCGALANRDSRARPRRTQRAATRPPKTMRSASRRSTVFVRRRTAFARALVLT